MAIPLLNNKINKLGTQYIIYKATIYANKKMLCLKHAEVVLKF